LEAAHLDNKIEKELKKEYSEIYSTFLGDLVIPKRRLQENYTFTAFDWVQMPFALLIGGLNVMDDVSNGYKCSRNTTTCRTQMKRAF